jgi:O-methyltransferase
MSPEDLSKLKLKLREAVTERQPGSRVAVAGWSAAAFEIAADPVLTSGAAELIGIFAGEGGASVKPLKDLPAHFPDILVIAEDAGKEPILEAIALTLPAKTKIVIGGFSHFEFSDPVFDKIRRDPSFRPSPTAIGTASSISTSACRTRTAEASRGAWRSSACSRVEPLC